MEQLGLIGDVSSYHIFQPDGSRCSSMWRVSLCHLQTWTSSPCTASSHLMDRRRLCLLMLPCLQCSILRHAKFQFDDKHLCLCHFDMALPIVMLSSWIAIRVYLGVVRDVPGVVWVGERVVLVLPGVVRVVLGVVQIVLGGVRVS